MNAKTLVLGIAIGGIVSFGTYFFLLPSQSTFFLPAPQSTSAYSDCATYDDVVRAISYCMDAATIYGGTISTYC